MTTGTHLDMHRQHQRWLQDVLLWIEEASVWSKQNQKAVSDLARLTDELGRHGDNMADHLDALNELAHEIGTHEHALASFEGSGSIPTTSETLLLLAKKHRDEARLHDGQQGAHTELKQRHHALMTEWMRLLKEIGKIDLR